MTDNSLKGSASDPEIITAEVAPSESDKELSPNEKIAASRWQVLVLLFMAAGPLALPLLFRSSCFSRFWKIVLFLLVIVQTILVVVVIVVFARWFISQIAQLRHAV